MTTQPAAEHPTRPECFDYGMVDLGPEEIAVRDYVEALETYLKNQADKLTETEKRASTWADLAKNLLKAAEPFFDAFIFHDLDSIKDSHKEELGAAITYTQLRIAFEAGEYQYPTIE
jgi:hypothetical protein